MRTVKEIEQLLQAEKEPALWFSELEEDKRIGVQKALKRWHANYEKRLLKVKEYELKKAFDASYEPFPEAMVAGVDEAGRGPLAGPVVTAAVILPENSESLIGLDDSKALTKQKREQLANQIKEIAIAYSVHIQPAAIIDELNIYAATKLSMEEAVKTLTVSPNFIIADAMKLNTGIPGASVTKADAQSLAVAAASILAKTARDDYMNSLHTEFPMYQFAKNAGYGTAEHLAALKKYGPSAHHRKSFEPVKSLC